MSTVNPRRFRLLAAFDATDAVIIAVLALMIHAASGVTVFRESVLLMFAAGLGIAATLIALIQELTEHTGHAAR